MSETRERGKPFVAWTWPSQLTRLAERQLDGSVAEVAVKLADNSGDEHAGRVPVVVTPLLPDDPRVGETWETRGDWLDSSGAEAVSIIGPVVVDSDSIAWVETSAGIHMVSELRRPPVMKTFRVDLHTLKQHSIRFVDPAFCGAFVEVYATSREAALAKLAESLEEVS